MNYLSLFSGIGGFELAIQHLIPTANCIGFAEVDKFAVQVYQHHFPTHHNLGDITQITEETIRKLILKHRGCNLLVAGFPCTNLTSLARQSKYANSDGLDGPKSGMFWDMINVIRWINKYNQQFGIDLHFIIENNGSMKNEYKTIITETLSEETKRELFLTTLNGQQFGVQKRRRLYWTTFPITGCDNIKCEQTWDDVLQPLSEVRSNVISQGYITKGNKLYDKENSTEVVRLYHSSKSGEYQLRTEPMTGYYTIWQRGFHSDTDKPKSTPVIRGLQFENILIDRRVKRGVLPRFITGIEAERLFFIPDGWVSDLCSKSRTLKLLGNTVIVRVIEFIVLNLLKNVELE